MRVSRRLSAVVCAVTIAAVGPTVLSGGPLAVATPLTAAAAASSRAATPYVAVLGDSYSSGEAGRWAGSSDISTSYADALGPTAYFDNASHTAERIPGCHRSRSDEAYIGRGIGGVDLACSGATTRTYTDDHGHFKPGLDFCHDASGNVGQARALRRFASSHLLLYLLPVSQEPLDYFVAR